MDQALAGLDEPMLAALQTSLDRIKSNLKGALSPRSLIK